MKNSFFIFVCLLFQTSFSQNSCKNVGTDYSGFCQEYHQNGKISWIKEFKQGEAVGTWMYFNEKGNLTKQLNTNLKKDSLSNAHPIPMLEEDNSFHAVDRYREGEEASDFFQKVEMPEIQEEIFHFVDEDAKFNADLLLFISKKLVYPQTAMEMGYQGRCYMKFVVEKDGSISNVSVARGVPDCRECDKEAIRIIKSMPNWFPGKIGGKAVRSWYQIPVNFALK